jgi:hypothetical protein
LRCAFEGLPFNVLDFAPEENRDLFDVGTERKGAIEVEQVVFRPRLIAVTISTHRYPPHHSTRKTLRVDLAQTAAAPTRLSNTATMRNKGSEFCSAGFQSCGNRLSSMSLFFSIVD